MTTTESPAEPPVDGVRLERQPHGGALRRGAPIGVVQVGHGTSCGDLPFGELRERYRD